MSHRLWRRRLCGAGWREEERGEREKGFARGPTSSLNSSSTDDLCLFELVSMSLLLRSLPYVVVLALKNYISFQAQRQASLEWMDTHQLLMDDEIRLYLLLDTRQ